MNWLDVKYINLLSPKLDRFKRVQDNFNFRCPICGDSKTNRSKARGWLLSKADKSRFYCHNCSASMTFRKFLKLVDHNLYFEYVKDSMLDRADGKQTTPVQDFAKKMKTPEFIKSSALDKIKKISQLRPDHPAKIYINSRMIPSNLHYRLFYAPKFKTWVNTIIPNKFENVDKDEPRLIIPFLDEHKNMFGFQGRSFFLNDPLKYITIMIDENTPKLFGLDSIDKDDTVYVFEGPIDAMFIKNSIASAGGRIDSSLGLTSLKKRDIVLVYDNEPRSIHTIKKIECAIEDGYRVCMWPDEIREKDVNDMILAGRTSENVKNIIDVNTYSGLAAKLKLATWKKV